ncbi:MAG: DUF481 domain-containing protein [Saprospiraceae bacterium]|nr:DUF481 domain-containing protein [Saprospiraceae bacterium]
MKAIGTRVCFVLSLVLTTSVQAQLVNIENKRMLDDSIKFTLMDDFSFRLTDNNGDYIYQLANTLTTQVKTKNLNHNFFFTGNYHLIRSNEKDFSNIWMMHLRYNFRITQHWRIESFLQLQEDQLLDISKRKLWGIGVRWRIINNHNIHLNFGTTYMYEKEQSEKFNQSDYYHRNSTYCAFSYKLPKRNISVSNTLYFQPLFTNINDHRILEEFRLAVQLTKAVSFITTLIYYEDAITPSSLSQSSTNALMGIGVVL